jgi:N-acetylmuramoyl-L-alanine amidase
MQDRADVGGILARRIGQTLLWLALYTALNPGAVADGRTPSPPPRPVLARVAKRPVPVSRRPRWVGSRPHLYRIRWGDTLWTLANRFDLSVPVLEAANRLTDPNLIYAGDDLIVPGRYVVQPGDTLRAVARATGVPLVLLWHANRLTSDRLQPDQVLVVPYTGPVPLDVYEAPPMRPPLPARGEIAPVAPYTAEDLLALAHLVQAEAGNQPFVGMVAVAAVVMNRVRAPGFPKTIPAVIQQPGQFESVANGSYRLPPGPLAVLAAKAALAGWDPTHGALYFYNPHLTDNPWMASLPITAEIGAQVFCR